VRRVRRHPASCQGRSTRAARRRSRCRLAAAPAGARPTLTCSSHNRLVLPALDIPLPINGCGRRHRRCCCDYGGTDSTCRSPAARREPSSSMPTRYLTRQGLSGGYCRAVCCCQRCIHSAEGRVRRRRSVAPIVRHSQAASSQAAAGESGASHRSQAPLSELVTRASVAQSVNARKTRRWPSQIGGARLRSPTLIGNRLRAAFAVCAAVQKLRQSARPRRERHLYKYVAHAMASLFLWPRIVAEWPALGSPREAEAVVAVAEVLNSVKFQRPSVAFMRCACTRLKSDLWGEQPPILCT
jgi:hypothetical protein